MSKQVQDNKEMQADLAKREAELKAEMDEKRQVRSLNKCQAIGAQSMFSIAFKASTSCTPLFWVVASRALYTLPFVHDASWMCIVLITWKLCQTGSLIAADTINLFLPPCPYGHHTCIGLS